MFRTVQEHKADRVRLVRRYAKRRSGERREEWAKEGQKGEWHQRRKGTSSKAQNEAAASKPQARHTPMVLRCDVDLVRQHVLDGLVVPSIPKFQFVSLATCRPRQQAASEYSHELNQRHGWQSSTIYIYIAVQSTHRSMCEPSGLAASVRGRHQH